MAPNITFMPLGQQLNVEMEVLLTTASGNNVLTLHCLNKRSGQSQAG